MANTWQDNEYKLIRFDKSSAGTDISDASLSAWLTENAEQFLQAEYDLNNIAMGGQHTITCKGRATGYQDSEASNSITIYVYVATITNTGCTYVGSPYMVQNGAPRTLVFTAAQGYDLPSSVTVTGCDHTWDQSTGTLVLSNPTGNPSVTVTATQVPYSITTTVTGGTSSGSSTIDHGGTASVTITPTTGYALPSNVTVVNATSSYNDTTGVISLSNPTGAVTIKADCNEILTLSPSYPDWASRGVSFIYGFDIDAPYSTGTEVDLGRGSNPYTFPANTIIAFYSSTANPPVSTSWQSQAVLEYNGKLYAARVDGAPTIIPYDSSVNTVASPANAYTAQGTPGCFVFATRDTYSVNGAIEHGYIDPIEIIGGYSYEVQVSAMAGYTYPSSVSVTGATYTYNPSTGKVVLSNPTGTVTISGSCVFVGFVSASVSNLGSENPANVTFTKDNAFPTSFEEWRDPYYNVFVKIPTMFRKVNAVENGQITSFSIATGALDSEYEPYPCFVYGNEVLPFVCIGKYMSTNNSSRLDSVENSSARTYGLGTARTRAQACGTGYQLYDWMFHKLFQDLAIIAGQTVQSGNITEILGITQLTSGEMWCDGITKQSGNYEICYDPANYSSSDFSNYESLSYTTPGDNSSQCVSALGYDSSHPFANWASALNGSNYQKYYCSGCYTGGSSQPVTLTLSSSASGTSGFFMQATTNSFNGSYRARLCYRPIND